MEQRKKRILIVEDERDISEILMYNIKKQGFDADAAFDGEKGLALALSGSYDLILLDVMLPKMDGFEICRRVRMRLDTPIIMLTAREEENDKIMGLDLGADDYMTKPFSLGELTSRIKANIRRYSGEAVVRNTEDSDEDKIIKIEDLEIDTSSFSVAARFPSQSSSMSFCCFWQKTAARSSDRKLFWSRYGDMTTDFTAMSEQLT